METFHCFRNFLEKNLCLNYVSDQVNLGILAYLTDLVNKTKAQFSICHGNASVENYCTAFQVTVLVLYFSIITIRLSQATRFAL